MERCVIVKNNLFIEIFLNSKDAQNHALETFEAILINDQLYDKFRNKKYLREIYADNSVELVPLKSYLDPHGIFENEVANVHIEDGQLVVTLKNGTQKKISV
ncbi:MAG: hypothetical protein PHW83_09260 [Bacteroidales bacterium]|nr:hypothetical protein [Bacteroidales bacterium]